MVKLSKEYEDIISESVSTGAVQAAFFSRPSQVLISTKHKVHLRVMGMSLIQQVFGHKPNNEQ